MSDKYEKPWDVKTLELYPQGCEGDCWKFEFWNCDDFQTNFYINESTTRPYFMESIPLPAIKRLRDFFDFCLTSADLTIKEGEIDGADL